MNFPTEIELIEKRIQEIDPIKYAATRNYSNGALTYLSPYISRGVISTRMVYNHLSTLDLTWLEIEKLVQELAWRDYWQQVWIAKGEEIYKDLKNGQAPVSSHEMPTAILTATTGIDVVDKAIKALYETGYMHNHVRMYVASICCNIAYSHWLTPARWMYAYLFDGDLASNFLSWQWIAGTFSSKKYYANQNNINTYFESSQRNTFLDVDYEDFDKMPTPEALLLTRPFFHKTILPEVKQPTLDKTKITLLYNSYNLDPYWKNGENVQRVLLLEPSHFAKNPVSQQVIDFILELAKNIYGIQVFVGEFSELHQQLHTEQIIFREHPSSRHYKGKSEPREWLTNVSVYFPSFSAFWKIAKKELNP